MLIIHVEIGDASNESSGNGAFYIHLYFFRCMFYLASPISKISFHLP